MIGRVCFVLILGGRIYSMTANVLPEEESMIQNESYDIATDCIASSAGVHPENLTMVHFPAHGISPSEESYNQFFGTHVHIWQLMIFLPPYEISRPFSQVMGCILKSCPWGIFPAHEISPSDEIN